MDVSNYSEATLFGEIELPHMKILVSEEYSLDPLVIFIPFILISNSNSTLMLCAGTPLVFNK
jgi:hypothetical protein